MKGELEIGDILEVCNIRIECRESQGNSCNGCYWLTEEEHACTHPHNCGLCSPFLRTDHKDVIFVKIGEVQNA